MLGSTVKLCLSIAMLVLGASTSVATDFCNYDGKSGGYHMKKEDRKNCVKFKGLFPWHYFDLITEGDYSGCSDFAVCCMAIDERMYDDNGKNPYWVSQSYGRKVKNMSLPLKANGIWELHYNFETEAKRRGLSCGVKKVVKKQIPSQLKSNFNSLPIQKRKLIQTNLTKAGLYKSEIDGLYGKKTSSALVEYNKRNLGDGDLKKAENVTNLLQAVLAFTPSAKPTTKTEAENIERLIEIQKEFGLSFYGGFFHSVRMPNTLFFFDDIRPKDSFEFHKALRNHDITLVVLSSRGGDVDEGLLMAGTINDRN